MYIHKIHNQILPLFKIAIFLLLTNTLIICFASANDQKDLSSLVKKVSPSVVLINTFDRQGKAVGLATGFFIDEGHTIVSNYHVVKGAAKVEARLPSGETVPIEGIVAEKRDRDLVLLAIGVSGRSFPALKFAAGRVEVGQPVAVIGNPLGLEGTVSEGIISAIRYSSKYGKILQITAPISKGSSGSPVVNIKGEVVGVTTFLAEGGQNLNFAIAVDMLYELDSYKYPKPQVFTGEPANSDIIQKPQIAPPGAPAPIPPARDSVQVASQIQTLKEIVKKDPKNLPAWVELGNLYFDTDQPKEAIEAYSRYLASKPDNPDVRNDLGIMYRKLGQFDRALEEFRKAAQSDPKHVNSRYNIGLVLLHDKQDTKGAIKAWEDYLKVDPNSERAQRVRAQIQKMKAMSSQPK